MNHKWIDNTCTTCGIKRKKVYVKRLMAIVNHPPWNCYLREMVWLFSFDGATYKEMIRPNCKNFFVNSSVIGSVPLHSCKYCKAETTQPDNQCYKAPKEEAAHLL